MPHVKENQAAEPESAPGFGKRIKGFLLPDGLRPPGWSGFRGRWIALFVLSAGWLAALKIGALWPEDELASHLCYAAAGVLLLALGIGVYGPRRLAGEFWPIDGKLFGYHVVVVTVLVALVGIAFERLGTARPAPEPPALEDTSRALICARLLAVGLLRPAAEEFALRLVCFGGLRLKLKFLPAAVVSSALFGLLHWPDPARMAAAALAGLLFCWVYERTRSIAAPVLVHVLNNLLGI